MSNSRLEKRLDEYKNKAQVLRQINSNQKSWYYTANKWARVVTVITASIIAFIGFIGEEQMVDYAELIFSDVSQTTVSFYYDISIIIILVTIFVELLFNFPQKEREHNRAIVILTSLVNDIDDILEVRNPEGKEVDLTIQNIRSKYELITESIPPNSDEDFLQAKKDLMKKKEKSKNIESKYRHVSTPDDRIEIKDIEDLKKVLIKEGDIKNILIEVRDELGDSFWVSGGAIRNRVWDIMHGYKIRTSIEDIDIIYYDKENTNEEDEKEYERRLQEKYPNICWQVKNQARMHYITDDDQYESLKDALQKWPETCTAVAVKIDDDKSIEVLAPCGVTDLLKLIVRPTHHFRKHNADRYLERISSKEWKNKWPKLSIKKPTEND